MSSHVDSVALGPAVAFWASVTVYIGIVTLEAHMALSFSSSVIIKTRLCFLDGSKINVKVKLDLFFLGQPETPSPSQQ